MCCAYFNLPGMNWPPPVDLPFPSWAGLDRDRSISCSSSRDRSPLPGRDFRKRTRGNRLLGHDVHIQILGQSLRRKARQTSRPLHLSIKRIKEVVSWARAFFHGHLGHEYKQSILNKHVETMRILLCTSKISPGIKACPLFFFPLFIWACSYCGSACRARINSPCEHAYIYMSKN